jgi:hypothetical protein
MSRLRHAHTHTSTRTRTIVSKQHMRTSSRLLHSPNVRDSHSHNYLTYLNQLESAHCLCAINSNARSMRVMSDVNRNMDVYFARARQSCVMCVCEYECDHCVVPFDMDDSIVPAFGVGCAAAGAGINADAAMRGSGGGMDDSTGTGVCTVTAAGISPCFLSSSSSTTAAPIMPPPGASLPNVDRARHSIRCILSYFNLEALLTLGNTFVNAK